MIDTPAGPLFLGVHDGRLSAASFHGDVDGSASDGPVVDAVRRYLDGELNALDEIPVEVTGTPLQEKVWSELRRISPGTTISYSDLARAVGAPRGVRAVANAVGANPVPVVIPCHRVVRSDGTLGGYGGGLDRKRALLAHEGIDPDRFG